MQITIEISEPDWQSALSRRNAVEAEKHAASLAAALAGNKQAEGRHQAIMAQTPPSRRTKFAPPFSIPVAPEPMSLGDFIASVIRTTEEGFAAEQVRDHLNIIAKASAPEIARLARVTALPQAIKDELADQVDALTN